jgi:hypothetical protein
VFDRRSRASIVRSLANTRRPVAVDVDARRALVGGGRVDDPLASTEGALKLLLPPLQNMNQDSPRAMKAQVIPDVRRDAVRGAQ